MATEIELKYLLLNNEEQATMEQVNSTISLLLNNHALNFSYQQKALKNRYFDTPNLTLRQHRIALRSRATKHGNSECFEQTIKTSGKVIAGLHQRPEYNVELDNNDPILSLFPESIWRKGTDVNTLQQDIVELFSTNFTRHTWLITLANAQVELAFDSGNIACKGFDSKPSIYEIELELVKGDTKALFFVMKILFSKLALRPGQQTKAARGYALFHQSQKQVNSTESQSINLCEASTKLTRRVKNEAIEPVSLLTMPLDKNMTLNEAFKAGVSFSLTQLQLKIDSYVEAPSLNTLSKISEILALLRQGFWLFAKSLSDENTKLRSELSYFIRTIHWVDNARYIQALINKQSTYQKEASVNQQVITKLQLANKRYPCESQILSLFHSERFNNLQLALLALLLQEEVLNSDNGITEQELVDLACSQLILSRKLLSNELVNFPRLGSLGSSEYYFTAHSLLIRALLTTSWFSPLFVGQGSDTIKKFSMPWLDIKLGISELQSLDLLQQQLTHLTEPEPKLSDWLKTKIDNLIAALEQSQAKALSIKPYWS